MESNDSKELFRQLAADTFLERLSRKQFRSHNKHIIDYLPERERRILFSGLMERTDVGKSVRIRDEGSEELSFIETRKFDLLPFLVVDDEDVEMARREWGKNGGSEGFASSLRDYFGVGVDDRVRLLVVFTPAGNETQKSAQDTAVDEHLLDLEILCHSLIARHGLDGESDLREVVATYLDYLPHESWDATLTRLDNYLEEIAGRPKDQWGKHLGQLDVFIGDPDEEFADGDVPIDVPRAVKEKRVGDNSRLQTNAALKSFLEDSFDSPLVATDERVRDVFADQSADDILSAGKEGIKELDFGGLERREDNKRKNKFDWDSVSVSNAGHYHKLAGNRKDEKILLVATDSSCTVQLELEDDFDGEQEYIHLLQWNQKRSGPRPVDGAAEFEEGSTEVALTVCPDDEFEVYRGAITGSSRSYKRTKDDFLIAVYNTDKPVVAWENGLELNLEQRAWVRDSQDTAKFKEHTAGGEVSQRTISYTSTKSTGKEEDREPDGVSLDALVDTVEHGFLHNGEVPVRICWTEDVQVSQDAEYRLLEYAPYRQKRWALSKQLVKALRKDRTQTYLGALTDVTRDPNGFWNVEVGGAIRLRVKAWNTHFQEEAVAKILSNPDRRTVRRTADGAIDFEPYPQEMVDKCGRFLELRQRLFTELLDIAPCGLSDDDSVNQVQLLLADLEPLRTLIVDYYRAWLSAVDEAIPDQCDYGSIHRGLLQTDLLLHDSEEGVKRLVVMPTHPWMLRGLLSFQWYFNQVLDEAASGSRIDKVVSEVELEQFVPTRIVEDWFFGSQQTRFRAEDATPFHLTFLPEHRYQQSASLDYVSRVVRNKINRYLEMHNHLRDSRRTLRIGFINAGDGKPLFDGIRHWFNSDRPGARAEHEDWLGRTPTIEVTLFDEESAAGERSGAAFDDFFREHLDSAGDRIVDQAMLSKLRYGKREAGMPEKKEDYLHICFAAGLVKSDGYKAKDGKLSDGWDGCFAGGLMPTTLRRTVPSHAGEEDSSERGLWVSPQKNDDQRLGLARLLTLLCGANGSMLDKDLGMFWRVSLPTLEDLEPMYDNSDWVVHLDRELGLELFRGFGDEDMKIIEYSDQEDPHSPGFDIITLTKHADPYFEQLDSVLDYADLESEEDSQAEKTATKRLLDDINILSGSWALDFLVGNIAQEKYVNRLKGNVGSALVFRWLRRLEEPMLKSRLGSEVVPVYVSLEELVRATPAANLPMKDGLVKRYSNENKNSKTSKWCDDLLILYLTPAEKNEPYKIFGRIIEVKFGKSAGQRKDSGISQVRGTFDLLERHLSGGNDSLEAPFRHRQLSLLIKSQLEQAVSSGIVSQERRDALNIPALSAAVAAGRYEVDYLISDDNRQQKGDLFLLSTPESSSEETEQQQAEVEIRNGVRVITLRRELLRWLAFNLDTAPTLDGDIQSTLPSIGRVGASLQDVVTSDVTDFVAVGGGLNDEPSEAGIERGKSADEDDENGGEGDGHSESSEVIESDEDEMLADGIRPEDIPDPGPVDGVELQADWKGKELGEHGRAYYSHMLGGIKRGKLSRNEYVERIVKWTGSDKAPGGKEWTKQRIFDFFSHYGYVEVNGGFEFRLSEIGKNGDEGTDPDEAEPIILDPGPVDGVELRMCNWSSELMRETVIPEFLRAVKVGEISWNEYADKMKTWTFSEKAPGNKNWSRERILSFFRRYGFVDVGGEFKFLPTEIKGVDFEEDWSEETVMKLLEPGPLGGVEMTRLNWKSKVVREKLVPSLSEEILNFGMAKKFSGSDTAPGGKPWTRARKAEFFEHYGFVESDGVLEFRPSAIGGDKDNHVRTEEELEEGCDSVGGASDREQTSKPSEESGSLDVTNSMWPGALSKDEKEEEGRERNSGATATAESDAETAAQERVRGQEEEASAARRTPKMPLKVAIEKPLKEVEPDIDQVHQIIERLRRVFEGHNIEMEAPPSVEEVEFGPRLLRVYVRLMPDQTISKVRNRSEDIARMVGTSTADIHIMNVTERRSVALDLPISDMGYNVSFQDLRTHSSFDAAGYELKLGFCAGVHITGTPHWVDLASMPHALVAGTTGSGKTVFLRSVIMELILTHEPEELDIRLSSSKPMDFKIFTQLPHASRREMATNPMETLQLVEELVTEMDRRIEVLSEAFCDNLSQYNADSDVDETLPRIVAVIDEFAETVLSFSDNSDRRAFEDAVGRLAQKARAAGIHLILCMQRPDSKVIQGAVKSNILHRFALKLPQNHDSRVILDEPGAEALLGAGDMLYKDASSKVHRLQVPYLDAMTLKKLVKGYHQPEEPARKGEGATTTAQKAVVIERGKSGDRSARLSAKEPERDEIERKEPRSTNDEVPNHVIEEYAQLLVSAVSQLEGQWGAHKLARILGGSEAQWVLDDGLDDLPVYGLLEHLAHSKVVAMLEALLEGGFVRRNKLRCLKLTMAGRAFKRGDGELGDEMHSALREARQVSGSTPPGEQYGEDSSTLKKTLRFVRMGASPEMIAGSRELAESTITQHLLILADRGVDFDLMLHLDDELLDELRDKAANWEPGDPITPIREALDEPCDWNKLKYHLVQVFQE